MGGEGEVTPPFSMSDHPIPPSLATSRSLSHVPQQTPHSPLARRGADMVLELVGSSAALRLAFDALRPMGSLSSVGVHTEPAFPFSPVDGYNKNIRYL